MKSDPWGLKRTVKVRGETVTLTDAQWEILGEVVDFGPHQEAHYAGSERRTLQSLIKRGLLQSDTLEVSGTSEGIAAMTIYRTVNDLLDEY